jgi:hypothetical protein
MFRLLILAIFWDFNYAKMLYGVKTYVVNIRLLLSTRNTHMTTLTTQPKLGFFHISG